MTGSDSIRLENLKRGKNKCWKQKFPEDRIEERKCETCWLGTIETEIKEKFGLKQFENKNHWAR